MIIDFEKDSVETIDNVVRQIKKSLTSKYTNGSLRTFVVDTVISSMNENQIIDIINNRIRLETSV